MAYAVKYVFTFQSVGGTTREVRILKDGYSGDPIRRALGRAPILKKQQNGPVHGTSLEMYAECHVDQEFIEFYTSDPKEYRVDLYAGSALLWQGWITPELYSEPDIAPPYDVQVIATDGVGELKLYDFAAQGMVSLRAMLTYLLGKTGLSTDVFLVSSLKAGSAGAGALLDMEANFDYLVGKTCYEALSYLLTTLHATITWWGGHWLLVRENNVTFTSGKVRYFNTAGNSALLANSVQELGSMYQDPAWPVGQLSTVIDPAKNKIVVQAPWHPVTALKNSDMTQDSDWGKILVTYDSTKGAYFFPRDVITAGELYQGVAFGGLRVPLHLTLSGCGTSEVGSGFLGRGNGWLGLVLRYVDGSNNVYYLGTDGDGNRRWEQATPGQTPVRAFKQDLLSVDVDRENADRIELDIPALAVGGTFPAGTLTVSIFGGAAYIFSAQLDVILNKGYQDILHIDNGARGEGDDTEVAIGRVTSDIAYYQAFVQGILLNDGALITAFSDANFTTGMDFLSFISRDYARSVALPRARVEGTVSLEPSVQLPPLVFAKDGLNYWLETWSWNLYEDELQISARTLPTATLTVESETITEAGGTASTGTSSGGASSTPSVGLNYFEPNEDRASLIQLKPAYDYLGPRKGLIFGRSSSEDVNVDLEVVNIAGAGEEPVYALHSKLPFYSDSFVSAGGISDGPGSTGIDLAAMWASLQNLDSVHTYDSYLIASAHIPDMSSVYGYLKQADIDPILALIPAQASSTNQLADKAFVNSSIATATSTYRGNYNEYSDLNLNPSATHAQVATKLGAVISEADANDYCFVEIPTSASTPTQIERTERYKYNGTGWEYEYTLNNSGFTAVQWAAINSNITAGKVSTYDTVAGYFDENGKLGTSHLPALYLGTTPIQTASAEQNVTGVGNLTMGWNKYLYMLDENGTAKEIARFYKSSSTTIMRFGGGNTGAANLTLLVGGSELRFQTGRSSATSHLSLTENASGLKSARLNGNLVMNNAAALYFYNYPAEGATAQSFSAIRATTANDLVFGEGTISRDYQTRVYGSPLAFYTGSSSVSAANRLTITADGIIRPYVDIVPNSPDDIDLGSATRFFAEAYAKKVYLAANTYLEVDSNGYVHLSGEGFYCDGFVSGGGLSTGGGTTGIDPLAMWKLLTNDQSLSDYDDDTKIAPAHIPDVAAVYNYVKSADISDMATKTWVAAQNFSTTANTVSNVAVGGSGHTDELAITKGGTTSYLTVPYATNVVRFKRYDGIEEAGGYDLNTLLSGGGITSEYTSIYNWANAPANMSYGGVVQLNPSVKQTLAMQLAWDIDHTNVKTGKLWWRDSIYKNSTHTWGAWHLIYDDTTLTKSVITGLLDAGAGTYVTLGTAQTITGAKTFDASVSLNNARAVSLKDSNGNSVEALYMTAANVMRIAFGQRESGIVYLGGKTINVVTADTASGPDIFIGGVSSESHNKTAASIHFHSHIGSGNIRNGVKVAADNADNADNADRLNLAVYTSNNVTSPWAPAWNKTLEVTYNGKVNIGAPSSTPATVNVAGTIWASTGIWSDGYMSAGSVASSSDERLKANIKDFGYSRELLMSLKPREWDWNGKTTMVGHSAGFVAQEVEPHLPYAVTERTYKQLTYDIFHALEVSALQDHDTRIKALEDENRKKDAKIAALEKEIKRLRAI